SSEINVGTKITIYLPAGTDPIAAEAAVHMQRTGPGDAAGTVLVVEDDVEVLQVAVETLHALGYEVLTATDGPSALRKLRHGRAIDLLFADVVMPKGMSGIELARQARAINPDLRILLASGYPLSA